MVRDAARRLKRSYSWVYDHLVDVGNEGCYKSGRVIFINPLGFRKLTALSAKAPRRGRPVGGGKRASVCADWCAKHPLKVHSRTPGKVLFRKVSR